MEARRFETFSSFHSLLLLSISLVIFQIADANAEVFGIRTTGRGLKSYRPLYDKDIDVIVTYSDASGAIRAGRVKMSQLSPSWIIESPNDRNRDTPNASQGLRNASKAGMILEENVQHSMDGHQSGETGLMSSERPPMNPVKIQRRLMRRKRWELRVAKLIQQENESGKTVQSVALEQSRSVGLGVRTKYSIWRRDYESPRSDSTLKLMRDQIIMAKAYANIAKSKNESSLYLSLLKHCRESERAIGDASSDAGLHPSFLCIFQCG